MINFAEIKFNISNLDLQRFLGPLRRPKFIIEICQLICNQVERFFKEGKVGSRIATCIAKLLLMHANVYCLLFLLD